jgi:hypothetical protein
MSGRATACAAVPDSHRATKRYDWELRDDTKWLELAVNGIYRLGLLQAIGGAGGEGTDCRVEQSSARHYLPYIQSAHKFLVLV